MPCDRLLPGEPATSGFRDDAEHWLAVYTELVRFLNAEDLPLAVTIARYHRRIAYWRERLLQLHAGDPMNEQGGK